MSPSISAVGDATQSAAGKATEVRARSTRGTKAISVTRILIYVMLAFAVVVTMFPLLWMLSSAFKPLGETLRWPPTFLPEVFRPQNYVEAWQAANFTRVLANSAIVAVSATVLSVGVNALAAYGFSKFDFPGRNVLFVLVLGTLMVPFQVTMIPLFFIMRDLNLLNTYQGIVLPHVADAFGVFLLRQFMQTIPNEMIEAARIDGASELRIFWRVVLPLCGPALAVLAIFTFMWRWNEFLWPLIAVSSEDMWTVQLALANFQKEFYVQWHYLMALTSVSMIPILALFLRFQRHFVAGVTMTGMKG